MMISPADFQELFPELGKKAPRRHGIKAANNPSLPDPAMAFIASCSLPLVAFYGATWSIMASLAADEQKT